MATTKKPTRKADAMGNDSATKRKALLGAANKLMDYQKNPTSKEARPKGTAPAAPWAVSAGAGMSISKMGEKLTSLNKKEVSNKKAGARMGRAQELQQTKKGKK